MSAYKKARRRFLFHYRKQLAIVVLALLFIMLFILSIGIGTLSISPLNVLAVLFGKGDPADTTIIMTFRLPRVLLAAMAGAALAISGTILQSVMRNPLASPEIIGINSGASMMAVLFLALFNETVSIQWLPLFAFSGAAAVAPIIYGTSWSKGVSPMAIVLTGFGITALLEACKTLFLIFGPIWRTSQAQVWITGTVYGASWQEVGALLPWLLASLPILFIIIPSLNIQVLGDEVPIGLGSRVQLQRFLLIGVSALLSGSAVGFVGGIGFIGLMAPHISRRLVGVSHGKLLLCSALTGANLLIVADLMGRIILPPRDIPAGVFTSVIGAPFFLYLLTRMGRKNG